MATISATMIPRARATSVTSFASTSGAPPNVMRPSVSVPSSVTAGMVSAGMNSLLRQRAALASRSAGVVASGGGPASFRTLGTSAMTITSTPVTTCGSRVPARKVTA